MNVIELTALPHLLWASFLFYSGLSIHAFLRSRHRISLSFGLLMGCCAMSALAYYYEVSLESLPAKIVWMQIKFVFMPFITLLWLVFAVHMAGVSHWFRPIMWKLLLIIPVATVGFALSTQYHNWFRHDFVLEPLGPFGILHFQNGPWFRLYIIFAHSIGLLGIFVLLAAEASAIPAVRRQITGMLIAYVLPNVFDILFQLGESPLRGLNLSIFFLVPSSLITVWLVFHHKLLNLEPIARSVLLEHMEEGVVVVDMGGKIADLNARAENMLRMPRLKALGLAPESFPVPWRDLFTADASSVRIPIETDDDGLQWVESSSVELFDHGKTSVGRLYLLRDVTDAVDREAQTMQLIKLDVERERLREQQLLIRDLHDGLGALGANLCMLATRGVRETDSTAKNRLLEQINQLSCEIGMEIREVMNSLESREFFWGDLVHNLRRYAALVLDAASLTWKLTVEGEIPPSGPGCPAGLSLFRLGREAMNNLVKHAHAQTVEIRVEFSDGACQIEVCDDGQGFDLGQARPGGRGLKNMRNRVEELGGVMRLQTAPSGTRLIFTIPLAGETPVEVNGVALSR